MADSHMVIEINGAKQFFYWKIANNQRTAHCVSGVRPEEFKCKWSPKPKKGGRVTDAWSAVVDSSLRQEGHSLRQMTMAPTDEPKTKKKKTTEKRSNYIAE